MADLSDVETALTNAIVQIIYPGGTTVPSVTGAAVKIFRGWPAPIGLNADLSASVANISIFSDPKTTRETTRYPRTWRTRLTTAPTLTVSTVGQTVTFGGTGGSGQVAGVEVDAVVCSIAVGASDTPVSVASALSGAIAGSLRTGPTLTFPGAARVVARVGGGGVSVMETRRQEQGVIVSIWCSDPMVRDGLAASLDASLSLIDWLQFPDGSAGQLKYEATSEIDTSENANLYRRDLIYTVEYPTIIVAQNSTMVFGVGTIGNGLSDEAIPPARPVLGAIRFDAWYDPQDSIDEQCASALSSTQWLDRLPANCTVSGSQVSWPLAEQATLDAEILAALQAGLGFWAFDSYQPGDGLSRALSLYLTSSLRSRLRFCMLGQVSNWADPQSPTGYSSAITRDISMMSQSGYLTVFGGRPVYFVLDATPAQMALLPEGGPAAAIIFIRQLSNENGSRDPYIVWLSGSALVDYDNVTVALQVGADAAGAYACPRLSGGTQEYAALVSAAETDWLNRSLAGLSMVPTAMMGWDQRPLIETPQPFYPISPGVTALDYYQEGSIAEISEHVADLVNFTASNTSACASGLALIYAWNELVEGGWMMPTYLSGSTDTSRVKGVGLSLAALNYQESGSATFIV